MSESQNKKTITDPEIGNGGVAHPTPMAAEGAGMPASPEAMSSTLEMAMSTIASLKAENDALKKEKAAGADIEKFANVIASALKERPASSGPTEADPVNRSSDYNNKAMLASNIDSKIMAESQASLRTIRSEDTMPVSIPKAMATYVGPILSVSVNGIQVRVPVDGKTHFINKSHAIAVKERLAKISNHQAAQEPGVVELNG